MTLTFKEMAHLESELSALEDRMRAIRRFAAGWEYADFQDMEEIWGFSENPQTLTLCFASLEALFTRHLLLLVGPGGMHPKLKDPDCYSTAHRWLWRGFPSCRHGDVPCEDVRQSRGEIVLVDFSVSGIE